MNLLNFPALPSVILSLRATRDDTLLPHATTTAWLAPARLVHIVNTISARWAGLTPRGQRVCLSVFLATLGVLPLLVTAGLPLQDLPNHWAAMAITEHLGQYPEFESTGLLKTNALFFLVIRALHATFGLSWLHASKLFVAYVVVQNAITFPRVLSAFGGRGSLRAAGLFLLPLVHNWWILMGMVDFAASIPLALECLLALQSYRARSSRAGAVKVAVICLLVWYAHVFSALVLFFLWFSEHLYQWRKGSQQRRANLLRHMRRAGMLMAIPMALTLTTLIGHLAETSAVTYIHYPPFVPAWENIYNFWAECCAGLTRRSAISLTSFVPLVIGMRRLGTRAPWFSSQVMLVLAGAIVFGPYILTSWFHVNSRVMPILWLGCLMRARQPQSSHQRAALSALGIGSALCFSGTLAFDYHQLGLEQALATSALAAVPEGASVLPLVLDAKGSGEHTRPLLQSWGQYTVAKHISAPLLFSHSRSFPVILKAPPAPGQGHLELEHEVRQLTLQSCAMNDMNCQSSVNARWSHFWNISAAPYSYVLVIGAATPIGWQQHFQLSFQGKLSSLYVRKSLQ
jgi:hypothetical protein